MKTAEMEINDSDFCDRLKDIWVWLDANRFSPSTVTYFFLLSGMRLRVAFDINEQATAFATKFDGILVDTSDPGRPDVEHHGGVEPPRRTIEAEPAPQ